MTTAPMIASGVSRTLAGKEIVSGVDLILEPGKITALLGPSGAGKSTLLRLLAGLDDLDDGEILIGGDVISRRGYTLPPEKRRTGLVFQDFALFPHMTAAENVAFGLPQLPKPERQARALSWLERLQLPSRAAAYPAELSGGEQQRVAIARALAPEPAAILMDEPFSGLDPALRGGVAELTLSLIRDAGVPALWVTHDPAEAMMLADTLAIMQGGKIAQAGTPDDVYHRPVSLAVAEALGPVNTLPGPEPGSVQLVRPEDVRVSDTGAITAVVEQVAFTGPALRVQARMGDTQIIATVSHDTPRPEIGSTIRFEISTDRAHMIHNS